MTSVSGTSMIGAPIERSLGYRQNPKTVMYGQVEWQPISPELAPKVIKGDVGEGGSAVVKYAVQLAVLNNIPMELGRIRVGKAGPGGLQVNDVHMVVMMAKMCQAKMTAAYKGSKGISIIPSMSYCQDYEFDTKTCVSIAEMALAAVPILLFSMPVTRNDQIINVSNLSLIGATDLQDAVPLDYVQFFVFPQLRKLFGIELDINQFKRGFSPKGQGFVQLSVKTIGNRKCLNPITIMEPAGQPVRVHLRSFRSGGGFPSKCEEACQNAAIVVLNKLKREKYPDMKYCQNTTPENYFSAVGDGLGILLVCQCSNTMEVAVSAIGDPTVQQFLSGQSAIDRAKIEAERTGRQAATELVKLLESRSPVDTMMQDQLIVYMALARGVSKVLMAQPTANTMTAIIIC